MTFIAESAADAAAQVRARLGPQAVVVNVRPLPAASGGWFRRRTSRFEILAYRGGEGDGPPPVPPPEAPRPPSSTVAPPPDPPASADAGAQASGPSSAPARSSGGSWRVGALLEASGLQPALCQRVLDLLRQRYGDQPPQELAGELAFAQAALTEFWGKCRRPAGPTTSGTHIFLGAPGTGKTTCLCKWLTQAVLVDGRPAAVWRLDGQTANTSEALALYCEVLGVPVERLWRPGEVLEEGEIRFIDIPGTQWRDAAALRDLRSQVDRLVPATCHLVLNGAYDLAILVAQVRAFSALPIEDLIVTHLDEETRWGKLWNLVLGTNFSVRFLSAGQNIPGEFLPGSPEILFRRQFRA